MQLTPPTLRMPTASDPHRTGASEESTGQADHPTPSSQDPPGITELERQEVDRVMRAGVFDKAPRLGKFFRYICDCHLQGEGDRLKEYSIAIEALGRSTDFDPKKDSIVRVEAHRLRKRLQEFYQGPGASHDIEITIPNGQYRPQFIVRERPAPPPVAPPEPIAPPPTPPPPAPRNAHWYKPAIAAALVIAAVSVIFALRSSHKEAPSTRPITPPAPQNEIWSGKADALATADVRILPGYHGPSFMDRQGHFWHSDEYYNGGKSIAIPADVRVDGESDPRLLRTRREGSFHYDIPILGGPHELRLYFLETEYGKGAPGSANEGARTFNIRVNGYVKVPACDPLTLAGAPDRMHIVVLKDIERATDGKLHLSFEPITQSAIVSGIEIMPMQPGRIQPIRMVTQTNPVTDSDGRVWAADDYYSGGTVVMRENLLLTGKERALYQGERYGNFTYRLPLAPGKYRLSLHFAEQWWGTDLSNHAPVDTRIFDVFANGVAILRNFCPGCESHGPNRAITKTFDNLQPNAQGELDLQFTPVKNFAEVNGIEVVETQ